MDSGHIMGISQWGRKVLGSPLSLVANLEWKEESRKVKERQRQMEAERSGKERARQKLREHDHD